MKNESTSDDITIALQYNSRIQDVHKVVVPRNSNMRTVELNYLRILIVLIKMSN